jgi:hypothetical protein
MKRWVGSALAGAAMTGIGLAACVDTNSSIFVQGVLAPPSQTQQGQACTYTPTAGANEFLYQGVLDIAFNNNYSPVLLVASQLVPRGNANQLRAESSRVVLQGAEVRITDSTNAELSTFTVLGSGYVDPASGGSPGLGTFSATLVDPATVERLRPDVMANGSRRVIVYARVYGQTTGGVRVQTGEFQFPVTICYGCLVTFPPDSVDLAQPKPNCLASTSQANTVGTPCVYGQDQGIDCRLCQGNPVCTPR